ncbi:MAG: OadG family protein [Ruminococcus sp.]|nr:OadG family protein [Ruminococcus sp.]MDE7105431.1 OadG family protein [Ruminococcus sp.]
MNFFTIAVQTADSGTKIEIGDALLTAIIGYAVVFLGLILLMAVLYVTGAIFVNKEKKVAAKNVEIKQTETVQALKPDTPVIPPAPGSAGHIKLHGVPDKEAAMIMAIVADKMQTPLNELRFVSIKEVEK